MIEIDQSAVRGALGQQRKTVLFAGEASGRGQVQLHVRQRVRVHVRDGFLRRRAAVRAGPERDVGQGWQPVGRRGHRKGHVEQNVFRHHRPREYRRQRRPHRRLFAARHGPGVQRVQGTACVCVCANVYGNVFFRLCFCFFFLKNEVVKRQHRPTLCTENTFK